jgi:hypothetical protein
MRRVIIATAPQQATEARNKKAASLSSLPGIYWWWLKLAALVPVDSPIEYVQHSMCVFGDVVLVGYQDDCVALIVKFSKQHHDLLRRLRIEITGRLVGEDD